MTRDDFACNCGCGQNKITDEFVRLANVAEQFTTFRWKVNSGYRCPAHDEIVGGKGNHTKGEAGDFTVKTGWHRFQMVEAALHAGFKRIGIGDNFIHLDTIKERPQEVMWTY